MTILIIEDDAWFAQQQIRTLTAAGFRVKHAVNGLAGIEAIDDVHPDLVLLDVFLPGPNALALLHEMQSHSDLSTIPVLVCTSSASQQLPGWLSAYGVSSVLDKTTMTPAGLVAAVKKVLL